LEIIYSSDAVHTPTELLEKLAPWLPKLVDKKPLVAQCHYSNQDLTFTPGQALDLCRFGDKVNPDFSYTDRLIYIYKKQIGQLYTALSRTRDRVIMLQ